MSALWEGETQSADGISITPFGTIESTNLQDALVELAAEAGSGVTAEQSALLIAVQPIIATFYGAL